MVPVKDIEVSKQWVGTEESEQKEIQAQLQYRIKDSNNEYVNYGEPVTLKSPDWFYRWNDVPTQNAQKDYLEYRVKELEVPTGFISELVEGETRTEDRTTSGSVMKTVWAPISDNMK
ncbi:Cna B-type domain-containing protein [Faecalibaculum rodentium]|uniref:Cna B-type domain-containing protein n=1 Tax=Faecalibaculum rodentium TaxID=1702221 RepID=UPI0025B1664C|nr:Cna B-type domain-containing protein [Faecalibaculum rodentium]